MLFRSDLVDPQGKLYSNDMSARDVVRGDLIHNLENSRGIIFLFDPIREFRYGDGFEHTVGVLNDLAQRMSASRQLVGGRLPHYIAVCVTKFDEVRVLQTAEKLDLLITDPNDQFGFPRVDDAYAGDLFAQLCQVSQSGNADLMLNYLRQHFAPERIGHFVTSAIGFHVDPLTNVYNPGDFQNHLPDPGKPGQMLIRGTVHPINVVEPIMWLARKMAAGPGR